MAKTVLHIKTDVEVKKEAQKLAESMGIPLSTVINAQLKQFIADRSLVLSEPLRPSTHLQKVIKQAEKDLREGNANAFSPAFTNADDAIAWLMTEDDNR